MSSFCGSYFMRFLSRRDIKPAFFKRNPQLYIKPLGTDNNTKEMKRQKKFPRIPAKAGTQFL